MSVDINEPRPLFRGDKISFGTMGETVPTALKMGVVRFQDEEDQSPVGTPILELFMHSSVIVGIVPNFTDGSLRTKTWIRNTKGFYEEQPRDNHGFFYWNREFEGASSNPEKIANLAAAAAGQLEAYQSAVNAARLRGKALILH